MNIAGGIQNYVKAKRSYTQYLLPYKSTPSSRPKTAVLSREDADEPAESGNKLDENYYIFRPGTIPPSRQMFYQVILLYQLSFLDSPISLFFITKHWGLSE